MASFDDIDDDDALVEEELGPVDVRVDDAMTTVFAPAWDVKPADFARAELQEIPARFIVAAALDGRRSKVIGSLNKMLVVAGSFFRGLGNQYAAIEARDTQVTDMSVSPERPNSLHKPADVTQDGGAHRIFDPSFLRSVRSTARTFATALGGTTREKVAAYRAIAVCKAATR